MEQKERLRKRERELSKREIELRRESFWDKVYKREIERVRKNQIGSRETILERKSQHGETGNGKVSILTSFNSFILNFCFLEKRKQKEWMLLAKGWKYKVAIAAAVVRSPEYCLAEGAQPFKPEVVLACQEGVAMIW